MNRVQALAISAAVMGAITVSSALVLLTSVTMMASSRPSSHPLDYGHGSALFALTLASIAGAATVYLSIMAICEGRNEVAGAGAS